MKKALMVLGGFLLFIFGIISLVLNFIGMEFAFFLWMDRFGQMGSFVIKLLMIMFGVILVFFSFVDWERENAESAA